MTPQRLARRFTRRDLLQYSAKAALAYPALNFAAAMVSSCGGGSSSPPPPPPVSDDQFLDQIERAIFQFFWEQASATTGQVKDRALAAGNDSGTISSIASTGFGLTALCIGHKRGYGDAAQIQSRVATTLDFLANRQTNVNGFFYHFIGLWDRKAPRLQEFSVRFLSWVESATLAGKSKTYHCNGWRLLSTTRIVGMRLDQITKDDVEGLSFSRSASNANCALRTLRRMLHKAEEWNLIGRISRFRLLREHGRRLRLDDEAEQKLLVAAKACNWKPRSFELFRDIIILARDTGMRNGRELYRIRMADLDWNNRIIFVPDSKTANGRRMIPMSDRVYEILRVRAGGKSEGWLFPSNRSKCGHLTDVTKQFCTARTKAGLPEDLVLYCSRHDHGTRVLANTGNLAAVMKTMGHKDVRAAMQYQHPELELVRAALNRANESALQTSA